MEQNVAKFRKSGPPHQVQFSDEGAANIKPPAPHGRFNARRSYQHDAQASGSFACSPTRLRVVLVFSPDEVEMEREKTTSLITLHGLTPSFPGLTPSFS